MRRPPLETQGSRIEIVASVALLALLVIACFVVLWPFLAALSWALILSITTWPLYHRLERRLNGRRSLAALLMTMLLALAFVLPFAIAAPRLAQNVAALTSEGRALLQGGPPGPPAWLATIPIVGPRIQEYWLASAADVDQFTDEIAVYLPQVTAWLVAALGRLGAGFLEVVLSVLATFFFYRDGPAAVRRLRSVGERVVGERGERLMQVAGETIKGVVYGIIGTAFAQGILTGLGLWLAGVPAPFFLGFLACFVSIIPGAAPLVWVPAAIWLFYSGATGWGVFLLIWGALVVGSVDNVIKPYMIGRGSALPLLLVFLGMFGGVMAFGFLGLFLGPTILAIGQALLRAWTPEVEQEPDAG
jgi:predicted PurR-regulated permease PerM